MLAALRLILICVLCPLSSALARESGTIAPAIPEHRDTAFARLVRDSAEPLFTRRTAVILGSGAALAALATTFEDPIATERFLDRSPWDKPSDVGNVYGNGGVLSAGAVALWAGGVWTHDANVRDAGFDAVRSLGITFATVATIKLTVRRTRPDGGAHSFPSGHTAGAFAVAPVLARHFGRRIAVPAYVLAVMTGMGRLEDRRHYLSDVFAGAAIGTAAGLAESRPLRSTSTPVGMLLTPGGLGLAVRF